MSLFQPIFDSALTLYNLQQLNKYELNPLPTCGWNGTATGSATVMPGTPESAWYWGGAPQGL